MLTAAAAGLAVAGEVGSEAAGAAILVARARARFLQDLSQVLEQLGILADCPLLVSMVRTCAFHVKLTTDTLLYVSPADINT